MAKVKPIGTKPTVKVKKDFLAIKIIVFVIFTLYAASLIFAVLYAFSISLKGVDEFHEKNLLPKEWLFSNYGQAFKEVKAGDSNMFVMLWNSIWHAAAEAEAADPLTARKHIPNGKIISQCGSAAGTFLLTRKPITKWRKTWVLRTCS